MIDPGPLSRLAVALALALAGSAGAVAQTPSSAGGSPPGQAAPRPGPVETAPLPPPAGASGPSVAEPAPTPPAAAPPPAPTTPSPAPPVGTAQPAPAPPAGPAASARPTLLPNPGDPVDVDDVALPTKPAAVLSGQSTWDDGFTNLKTAFRRLEEELVRAGMAPAGRPLTVFVQTDDMGFRYEAMIPVERAPDSRPPTLPPEIRFGRTPEGRALRFVHKGPYEDVDQTYETITAYLDAKGIIAKDAFIEEYATDLTEPDDPNLEINVFALPR